MPQIGWFEILIVIILAILIIGPKDFPIMLRKIGNIIGSIKKYVNDIQKDVVDVTDNLDINKIDEEDTKVKDKEDTKNE